MVGGTHIYGGFNLSPYLALRVFEAVKEITSQNLNVSLSHVDDDNCEICQKARATSDAAAPVDTLELRGNKPPEVAPAESSDIAPDNTLEFARDKETGHDAAQPGRQGREWAA